MPPPSFLERTEGLVVTFKFPELIGGARTQKEKELTSRQQEVLRLLSKQSYSSAQILKQKKTHLACEPYKQT